MVNKAKLATYGVLAGVAIIGGYFIYRQVISESAKKSASGIMSGFGASSLKRIGFDPESIPFLSKKEAAVAHEKIATAPSPAPRRGTRARKGRRGEQEARSKGQSQATPTSVGALAVRSTPFQRAPIQTRAPMKTRSAKTISRPRARPGVSQQAKRQSRGGRELRRTRRSSRVIPVVARESRGGARRFIAR